MFDVKRAVGFGDVAIVDVDSIFVDKGGGGALPGSDASTTASQLDLRVRNPQCAEAVEEVCLAADDAVVHVCVAQFSHIDLVKSQQAVLYLKERHTVS